MSNPELERPTYPSLTMTSLVNLRRLWGQVYQAKNVQYNVFLEALIACFELFISDKLYHKLEWSTAVDACISFLSLSSVTKPDKHRSVQISSDSIALHGYHGSKYFTLREITFSSLLPVVARNKLHNSDKHLISYFLEQLHLVDLLIKRRNTQERVRVFTEVTKYCLAASNVISLNSLIPSNGTTVYFKLLDKQFIIVSCKNRQIYRVKDYESQKETKNYLTTLQYKLLTDY